MNTQTKRTGTIGPVTQSATVGTEMAGAIGLIVAWVLTMLGVEVPDVVLGAMIVIIAGAGTLVGGKIVPPQEKGKYAA